MGYLDVSAVGINVLFTLVVKITILFLLRGAMINLSSTFYFSVCRKIYQSSVIHYGLCFSLPLCNELVCSVLYSETIANGKGNVEMAHWLPW
jgi:hypothetical protein